MKTVVAQITIEMKFPRLVKYSCGCFVIQNKNRTICKDEFCGFVIHPDEHCAHKHYLGLYGETWKNNYQIFNGSITIENDDK